MKKFTLLMAFLAIAISCSDDDDGNSNTSDIYGSWIIIKSEVYSGEDNSLLYTYRPENDCEAASNITFNEDETAISSEFSLIDEDCINENYAFTYNYNQQTQTLTFSEIENGFEDSNVFEVVELSSHSLVLRSFEVEDYNDDGIPDYGETIFEKLY